MCKHAWLSDIHVNMQDRIQLLEGLQADELESQDALLPGLQADDSSITSAAASPATPPPRGDDYALSQALQPKVLPHNAVQSVFGKCRPHAKKIKIRCMHYVRRVRRGASFCPSSAAAVRIPFAHAQRIKHHLLFPFCFQ